MIKSQGFIVVVCGLISIKLDGLLKPFQSQVVLLIFEVTQTQIVLGRSIIFDNFAGFREISNWSRVVFDLSVTVSSVEKGLEMGLPALDVLDSFSKIGDCIIEIHEPGMNETSIEVINSIVWFKWNGFLKLSQSVIDLVQHHHTVSSVGVVLRLLVIKSYGSTKIIHGLLIVTNRHKCGSSVSMILGMGWALVAWWSWLETSNGFREGLNGSLGKFFDFLFIKFFEEVFGFVVFLEGLLLFGDLFFMFGRFFFFCLGFCNFRCLHNFIFIIFTLWSDKLY